MKCIEPKLLTCRVRPHARLVIRYLHKRTPFVTLPIDALVEELENVSVKSASGKDGDSRSKCGQGKLRSYLLPPGAVGGLYGSGCFHFSNNSSVCSKSTCKIQVISICLLVSQFSGLMSPYLLPPRLSNMLICFEQTANVHRLAAPDISVDGPVQGELQGATIEGARACQLARAGMNLGARKSLPDGCLGRHVCEAGQSPDTGRSQTRVAMFGSKDGSLRAESLAAFVIRGGGRRRVKSEVGESRVTF